ncbi:uncharacterized protein [Henckelia pumila]|uniref:uncharacterized protein n=1 Tax=Henckelia pumila TaxID=405737 RepID=UPI003C6E6756
MAKENQNANQAQQALMKDLSSPYYLQNGDNPCIILVSHQLTGPNFNTWSRGMTMALIAKNKLSFVDDTIARPISDDLLFVAWNRCNSMVISWILNSQGSMGVSSYYTRLRILWDELKDYQPVSTCNCGAMKEWVSYHNQEYVMQLLMGLNESYSQVRAQMLMTDPLRAISKVFSLVVQEERQRSIHQNASK